MVLVHAASRATPRAWRGGPGACCSVREESSSRAAPARRSGAGSVSQLAEHRRQHVADHCRDVRRPDEPSGIGRPLCGDRPEEVGGQRAGDDVRRLLARADRVGALDLQDGLRCHVARPWGGERGTDPVRQRRRSGPGLTSSTTSSGNPGPVTNSFNEQGQAVSAANTAIPFHFPTDSLAYFQFVFGAITPLLFLGSVLGRIKFSAWCILVVLVVDLRLRHRRLLALGRWLLRTGGSARLLRRVRHPHVGRRLRIRRGLVSRAPAQARSRSFRPEQPGNGRRRCRHPVARLERLQRWGPVLRGGEHVSGGGQHQPRHRRRSHHLDGDGRLAHEGEETDVPGRCERNDLRSGRHHSVCRLGRRLGRDHGRGLLHGHRLGRLELPEQGPAVQQGR